jgi:magnesium chelatase subunit I
MDVTTLTTFGALKASGYQSKTIKTELRDNLIAAIQEGKETFPGMHGYEQTVIPQLERAILSQHNINLLGLNNTSFLSSKIL